MGVFVFVLFVDGALFVSFSFIHRLSFLRKSETLMERYRHIFYLPFYFQAVKGTSAQESGIRTIPYLASIILSSIVVGVSITVLGPYKPFMIFGGAVFTIGAGLIYTLQVSSAAGKWIGYQLLSGFGGMPGFLSSAHIPSTGEETTIFSFPVGCLHDNGVCDLM